MGPNRFELKNKCFKSISKEIEFSLSEKENMSCKNCQFKKKRRVKTNNSLQCRRFPPKLVQKGNRHHMSYVNSLLVVKENHVCNKFMIKRADTKRARCRTCKFFDQSLRDLIQENKGVCQKSELKKVILKDKHLISISREKTIVKSNFFCGEHNEK